MSDIEKLELKIARFLRAGVVLSGLLMFAGWALQFKWSGNPFYFFDMYDPLPIQEIIRIYVRNENYGALLSYAGLGFLISLPIIRVLLTSILFARQKEYGLALIAAFVLIGLIVSMSLGIDL
jgi:uncharacterized membrane protein